MKRILITGKNSYIGTSVEKWLLKEPDKFEIDTIDLKDSSWRTADFSRYDVVFHVAGIAHVSSDPKLKGLYYKVNRDLTIETAKKAKAEGVKQFIFMSSMIVYGASSRIGESKVITKDTTPQPADFYGDSKLQAENGIKDMSDQFFKVAIVRPPMIYGKESKGNYLKLSNLAKKTLIFPDIKNERSMLDINNLLELIYLIITNNERGYFFPQNKEYVSTSDLLRTIAEVNGKKVYFTKLFNPLIYKLVRFDLINKIFGSFVYSKDLSVYERGDYQKINFKQSIALAEEEV